MPQIRPRAVANRLIVMRNGLRSGILADRVDRPVAFWQRSMGLLVRAPLAPGEAVWLDPCGGIHTWGMRYPIDVLFLDAEHRVLRLAPNVRAWRMVFAPRGTRSVIELRAGEGQQVRAGDVIERGS